MFNYIVNIHNSEDHLFKVLTAINAVKSEQSEVYCVLDGCTDRSSQIVETFGFHKIITPDIRETAAITYTLNIIDVLDFNIILQDDVVLFDIEIEEHIKHAYRMIPNIGVLSFRHGANFEEGLLNNSKHAPETDLIQNKYQPDMGIEKLEEGYITERQVVYKSPICLSKEVIEKLGGYDSRFEPIAHDDTEYCVRAYKEGFKNYVCGMQLDQPLEWGGTRRFPEVHKDNLDMHKKHMDLLKRLYPEDLLYLSMNHPDLKQTKLW